MSKRQYYVVCTHAGVPIEVAGTMDGAVAALTRLTVTSTKYVFMENGFYVGGRPTYRIDIVDEVSP